MDIETITKLLDAGYTKADIDALSKGDGAGDQGGEGAGNENQAAAKKPEGEKDENKVEEKGAEIGAEFGSALKALTDTVAGLKDTVKAMQDANINGAKQSGGTVDPITDIMKSFIDSL